MRNRKKQPVDGPKPATEADVLKQMVEAGLINRISDRNDDRQQIPLPSNRPHTERDIQQYMLDIGLLSQLPNREADYDDPDDEPIDIEGEPLSETVIRERR